MLETSAFCDFPIRDVDGGLSDIVGFVVDDLPEMVGSWPFVGVGEDYKSLVVDIVSYEEGPVAFPPSVVVVASRIFAWYPPSETIIVLTFPALRAARLEGFVLYRVGDI